MNPQTILHNVFFSRNAYVLVERTLLSHSAQFAKSMVGCNFKRHQKKLKLSMNSNFMPKNTVFLKVVPKRSLF